MIVPRFCTQPLVSYSFSLFCSLSFVPFSVYSSFSFSLPLCVHFSLSLLLSISVSSACFCLLSLIQSLSILSLPCPPSLRLTSLFVSLSQSSISFPFTLGPTIFFSPSQVFPFLCLCLSAPAPPFRASPDRSLALVASLPNSALFKETTNVFHFSPASSCDICGS